MPTLRTLFPALALLVLTFSCAHAATLNVPSTQYPTIQAGINAAAPGDIVLIANGTYTGPGNVDLDFGGKNITVKSIHGASSTIIDCQGNENNPHRGFYFHSGETIAAVINGLTVQNGYPAADENGNSKGGGIDITNASSPTVTNCAFTDNQSNGIEISASSPVVSNCIFTGDRTRGIQNMGILVLNGGSLSCHQLYVQRKRIRWNGSG